jgi:hypothetical protein
MKGAARFAGGADARSSAADGETEAEEDEAASFLVCRGNITAALKVNNCAE